MKSLPESSPNPWIFSRVSIKAGLPVGFAYGLTLNLSRYFKEPVQPAWLVATLLGIILLLGAYGTYYWCRWLAALDELQRLIQLKAFALAIPAYLGLAVTGELLLRAGWPGYRLDGFQAVPVIVGLQFVAFLWFWWRHR